jgi:hypothetical protein
MKKLIALLLVLVFVLSLAACGGNTETPDKTDPSSNDTSSGEPLADGFQVEYATATQGYYAHTSIWHSDVVPIAGFECMQDEYLYLPEGTTIMSDKKFAVYCYEIREEYMVLDEKSTTDLGQQLSPQLDVKLEKGTYVLTKGVHVRFVVKGSLSDVKLYVPLEAEDEVKLGKAEDFTTK